MKRCLACNVSYATPVAKCPSCGAGPALVDGFRSYAPELARGGGGFKPSSFSVLARAETSSFWFQSRNELLLWALQEYCKDFRSFLEIGCGTGFVLSGVAAAFPGALLQGSEIFTAGLEFAAQRLPALEFLQMDARDIPFVDEYDAIGAFDVIEHIEEDDRVLSQMHAALKPDGIMLLTVPQHPWLWSAVDEYSCHVRRYSADELHLKVRKAGFQIVRSTSFVFCLLPAMALSRAFKRKTIHSEAENTAGELGIAPWLNAVFRSLLAAELSLIRRGVSFPAGGSRLLIARKAAKAIA